MAPKFGTSGLRGLVTELTPACITDYTRAFLAACPQGSGVHVGWDLRPSSPRIAGDVMAAIRAAGLTVHEAGPVPTPALALAAMAAGQAAVMITGSHIPADRNGLKFYVPTGEISKEDELAITAGLGASRTSAARPGGHESVPETGRLYQMRYERAFGAEALKGLTIGVYQHSSVARDILVEVVSALGATPVPLARSDTFVPVDTEAVDPASRSLLADWCREHGLDAVISSDGDADRPMLADHTGALVPGDVLGALTARMLGVRVLCTPVSSNSQITRMPCFETVIHTRIGSPFVIAAMADVLDHDAGARVAGYEANGGFLLGFAAEGPAGPLPPLMTRDCLLPILAPLAEACRAGRSLSALVADLPPVFTAADRVQNVPTESSAALIAELSGSAEARAGFFETGASETDIDLTDGLRVHFANQTVVHLRPSGNAPECRCYAEASDLATAQALVAAHLAKIKARLT